MQGVRRALQGELYFKILTTELEDRQPIIKEIIQIIYKKDLAHQLKSASNLERLCRIAETVGWKKLWDHVLDHGEACVTSLKNLVRVMCHPLHASHPCPLCEITELKEVLPVHDTNSNESWDTLFNSFELRPFISQTHNMLLQSFLAIIV